MVDFLDILVADTFESLRNGYYNIDERKPVHPKMSLKEAITKCTHAPIIAEIKPASPSSGKLRQIVSPADVAKAIKSGGAAGISVITSARHFGGYLAWLAEVKRHVDLPVLMKDVLVDPLQVEAAAKLGADAVLLIYSVFKRGYPKDSIEGFIQLAHSYGLEVLLEVHTKEELLDAVRTEADMLGVNNRDLRTLRVDLGTTRRVLANVDLGDKVVVSESGIQGAEDVRRLRGYGAKAFLVGSAIMLAEDVEGKVRELVMAYENR
ncbi:MAG: indole-3-glycerol-phosphate synthase [Thaumarchaeota archaeon]|nr:indole-3-glycerol-phosphate synthase [Nitrososphaerota archaeon]